jgi:hypothetical protein
MSEHGDHLGSAPGRAAPQGSADPDKPNRAAPGPPYVGHAIAQRTFSKFQHYVC